MPALHVMFKTVSTDCNLDCSYCYYRESLEGTRVHRRLDDALIERFIPEYMTYVGDVRLARMAWQGGEPTLAGLPFFRKVVDTQKRSAMPGTVIANTLQTNGVLLSDDWGAFLKREGWLVGVSLDGPREVHDALRRDRGGRGTFDRVMRGIDVLRRHAVDLNVLCVLGPHNIGRARELLEFFRAERFTHVQFIPAMDFQATEPDKPASYLITAEQYGTFLTEAYDAWYGDGMPRLSVRTFDNFLESYVGVPNDLCVHGDLCDAGIVVEHDGSAYPCDFYIHPRWRLGNVLEMPLREIAEGPARRAFVLQKLPLPDECARCDWLRVCKSGCARNRDRSEGGPDHFCASYKRFFPHADGGLTRLADAILNKRRYLTLLQTAPHEVRRTGRNEVCPCGSGRKHKQCCASATSEGSYLLATPAEWR